MKKAIISLCDFTGNFVEPWAKTGVECFIFDFQHKKGVFKRGNIIKIGGKIEDNLFLISEILKNYKVLFVSAFPPCTDLAVSGAAWFASKKKNDRLFQTRAMNLFYLCYCIGLESKAPFFVENPVSVASTFFRKPDFSFHPYEYGGYLRKGDKNPISEIIPSRDAYPKKTCLWTGNGFSMPKKKEVDFPKGYSPQHTKLGGKSLRTKNIRSATPRGFSIAIFKKYYQEN